MEGRSARARRQLGPSMEERFRYSTLRVPHCSMGVMGVVWMC